ncbi:MAG: C40 family peptidase [Lachnospiraceae bacterium]|nr:C40 family peptidase [Lachnospiraceae bacterium]
MKDMVMVKWPVLPVYKKSCEGSERTDELLYGMWGQLMGERQNGFVRICTGYGYEGWCRSDGLKYGEWDVCRTWCSSRAFVQTRFVDVLAEPRVSSEVMITLPRGSLITVCEEERADGWQPVELLDRRRGYVKTGQISLMRTGKRAGFWQWGPLNVSAGEEKLLRNCLVETAKGYLGTPYRWGGKSPEGIDCSGLCSLVYWLHGIIIYRDSRILPEYAVREIPQEQMKPADLLYFPGHMAMYLGEGKYIHSSFSQLGVTVNSLNPGDEDYFPRLAGSLKAVGSVFGFQET